MENLEAFLKKKSEDGLLRVLRPLSCRHGAKICFNKKEYTDFSSNDYLGLAGHPKLTAAAKEAIDAFGTSSVASRLLSGDLELHHRLEEKVAAFKNKEAALVFNSGYQANLGIISALYAKGDCVFSDRLNHASIIDGIMLSGARLFRFQHNDVGHLEALLKKERGKFDNALIVSETVFSMDGDRPPLRELVALKHTYGCQLLVDEAHATGIFGRRGSGIVEEEDLIEKVDLIMGTFSKALGSFGAYVATSKKIVDYFVNTCRSFIYSTALPPAIIACNLASIDLIENEPFRRKELLESAQYFRDSLIQEGFQTKGSSQIVPVVIGENSKTAEIARGLQERGFWVLPIRPPTVPEGQARLRLSLSYNHGKETLERLIGTLCDVRAQVY